MIEAESVKSNLGLPSGRSSQMCTFCCTIWRLGSFTTSPAVTKKRLTRGVQRILRKQNKGRQLSNVETKIIQRISSSRNKLLFKCRKCFHSTSLPYSRDWKSGALKQRPVSVTTSRKNKTKLKREGSDHAPCTRPYNERSETTIKLHKSTAKKSAIVQVSKDLLSVSKKSKNTNKKKLEKLEIPNKKQTGSSDPPRSNNKKLLANKREKAKSRHNILNSLLSKASSAGGGQQSSSSSNLHLFLSSL